MTAPNTGIIAHLRSGGSRAPEAPLSNASNNSSSISAFLRKRSSAQQNTAPMSMGMTYKPTPEQLGLTTPFLPAARVTQPNAIAWMDKSFLGYLRKMLHDIEVTEGGNRDAVSWGASGENFIIRDKAFFATNIAPRYFSIFSNSTFRLVAQSWGFVVDTDHQNGFESYHHPGFLRDDPAKCENLSMQEMKELAISRTDSPQSTSKTVEDALLLLAATASSHEDAPASPQGSSKDVVKKTNPRKFGLGAKKTSVIKARRASLNNASPLGTPRRSSLNNALSLGTAARRSSLTNTLTRRRSNNGFCMPQSKASAATAALLKSTSTSSPLEHSVIAPFEGMHMSPTSQGYLVDPNSSPQTAAKLAATEGERQGLRNNDNKTAMSSSSLNNCSMQNGAEMSGKCNTVTDHLRKRMR
jgi:hypothetical protein